MTEFKIDIASPPDRDKLVAQIMVGNEQCAEINQDGDELVIELYGRQDGQPWAFSYSSFASTLEAAKAKLAGTS
jgi:hypothetical protein